MNEAFVAIVVYTIKEKYTSEKAFYQSQLNISPQSWDRWKKGEQGLRNENIEKIMTLFTDYEGMLVKKVARNADIIPEVKMNPIEEFVNMKVHVAQKWIKNGIAHVEFIQEDEEESSSRRESSQLLRIEVNYDFWSYKDRIEFRLANIERKPLEMKKKELLEWINENLFELTIIK
ncbi:hypothetical protein [Lacticigenium naphthae]|uniref:hypothetical protein n=1 Tax=Lacticigenium naphthae TaxID=515351 RepID=UPI00040396AF|nr:hypothetical protein [Lacticigenium naphthae]